MEPSYTGGIQKIVRKPSWETVSFLQMYKYRKNKK